MRKFALSLVISLVLCIFVQNAFTQNMSKVIVYQDTTRCPDTIATIWGIHTSATNQITCVEPAPELVKKTKRV